MKPFRHALALAAFVLASIVPLDGGAQPGSTLDSLVAAERAFSALSVEKGMKEAFLTYLAEDGVVFQPTPVNGKRAWKDRAPSKATLVWEPEFAEISASGDLGYTTGPWEFRPPAEGGNAIVVHGHFNSVWRKQADGAWKVAADMGGAHGPPQSGGVGSGRFSAGPAHRATAGKPPKKPVDLGASCDRLLGARTRHVGISQAFQSYAAADVRLNLDGSLPKVGRLEALAALDTLRGAWTLLPTGSVVAKSNDLGASWGTIRRFTGNSKGAADTSAYLNVWRRDGPRWELVLSVVNPTR